MTDTNKIQLNRRALLKNSALGSVVAGAWATSPVVNAFEALARHQVAQQNGPQSRLADSPYGPIRPARDEVTGLELLQLPEGFRYASLSWTGDRMRNGEPVPPGHDGMGVIQSDGETAVLVRNHELGAGRLISNPAIYDNATLGDNQHAAGGNTNIHFSLREHRELFTEASLGGTLANCAGGVTPWGTWLSCEETVLDASEQGGRRHGYVFEVGADPAANSARPIIGMGRFKHEAVAVDPATGYVYLTEDNRNHSPIYRYLPDNTAPEHGALEQGGRLQAARIRGRQAVNLFTPQLGEQHDIEWVDIADPDLGPEGDVSGPCVQARAAGALSISRGEGIWYSEGLIYIVDTSAGVNDEGRAGYGEGAVWILNPHENRLRCIFASTDAVIGNNPDNITVSPRGGIVMCEDGGGVEDSFGFGERLLGLSPAGDSFIFAKNNIILSEADIASSDKMAQPGDYRDREIAGVCFDPSGHVMFFNIQTPGITFAVWGPWERGPLG